MSEYTVAQELSSILNALTRCTDDHTHAYYSTLQWMEEQFYPSGGGFDDGTTLDCNRSTAEKLVFDTSFHHMNKYGFYDGWTYHTVIVRPQFVGFKITISGRDRNDIKDDIFELFDLALRQVCKRIDGNGVPEYGWYFRDVWKKRR